MDQVRIEYIEDGSWGDILAPAFSKGLESPQAVFNFRRDFSSLRDDLESGNLADVYILDNEIAGDREFGAEKAIQIRERARELNKDVLVITLLCSNPYEVQKEYGTLLTDHNIPVRFKLTDAALIGFYIGSVIRDGRARSFTDWAQAEGIVLPENKTSHRNIQDCICAVMENHAGGFYMSPRQFVQEQKTRLARLMLAEDVPELDRLFPPSTGKEIK